MFYVIVYNYMDVHENYLENSVCRPNWMRRWENYRGFREPNVTVHRFCSDDSDLWPSVRQTGQI